MALRKIAVTDCEHIGYDQEKAVCAAHGVEFVKYDLKTEDDVIREMQEYTAIGVQYVKFTERVFENLPNLKCVVRYGVGVDNIDIAAASAHGVAVCNVPDYSVQEVASHAFAMMMALTRKLKLMDKSISCGEWNYALSIPITRYSEMVVGVIGIGRIGRAFAKMAHDIGCSIVAYDIAFPRNLSKEKRELFNIPDYITLADLDELFKISDVVSVHSPLSKESSSAIDESRIGMMKETAILINVSRGGLIREKALYEALKTGRIAGAACDVWEQEPTPKDNPLLQLNNFIATPHMAWYSEQASQDLKRKLAEELIRSLNGEPLKYKLN